MAALVACLLVISGCTSGKQRAKKTPAHVTTTTPTPTPTPSLTVGRIQFADCTEQLAAGLPRDSADRVNRLTFGCGRVEVPLDYDDPYGRTTKLYVVKVHDTSQSSYTGSLLVNPGGPGGSGVQLAVSLGLKVSLDVLDHFDVVGFDPRGVFLSDPVQCITNAQKDRIVGAGPDVRTPAGLAQAKALYAPIGPQCSKKYGKDLADYNTEYTARDMDLVRQGVRDEKMNYLGYSYGTRIGATYAHLFPSVVRAMVLDGAVDPVAAELVTDERQISAFEKAFDQFAADCAKRVDCKSIGPPRKAVIALAAKAGKTPLRTSHKADKRRASGAIVREAVIAALYDQDQWRALGKAILSAQRGDARGLFALTDAHNQRGEDGTYANLMDANTAVNCNDSTTNPTDIQIQALARTWAVKYPLFGLGQAASLLTCRSWPKSRHPIPPATAPRSAPILVIGTVHDPATPYAAAAVLAKTLGSGVLLTWNGEGHTAYPRTSCVSKAVDGYLIAKLLPPAQTACPLR